MSNIVRPGMRFARRQPLSAGGVRNSNPESTGRHTNKGNNRKIPRRTNGGPSGNRDSAGPWRRPEYNRILLVHGLQHMSINCDHVFNLFCLYGNVTIIKILKDKKVLVELETVEAAQRCMINLHQLPLDDGYKLNVKYSKHSFIYDHVRIKKLPDGTPAMKVYSTSRLHRFPTTRNHLETRHPAAPSKILHFYNAPTDVCGIQLHKAVSEAIGSSEAIRSVVILPKKRGANCSTGLIEMKSIDLAAKAISLINHTAFKSTRSRFPFLIKLCFSKWSEIQRKHSLAILLGATPRRPWYRHGSEHGGISATEFQVSLTTRVTSGDHSWTLWCLRDGEAKIAAAADPTEANNTPPVATSSGAKKKDRGDAVQCGLASVIGEHDAMPSKR